MSETPEYTAVPSQLPDVNYARPVVRAQGSRLAQGHDQASLTRRSEKLSHVLPRPTRGRAILRRKGAPRVGRPGTGNAISHTIQSKQRAVQRYLASIFGTGQDRADKSSTPEAIRRASSSISIPPSSTSGSIPNLVIVSPATLLFSAPGLDSGSYCQSPSIFPAFVMNSSTASLRRARTDSFSMLDYDNIDGGRILEPNVQCGITRTVTGVLSRTSTPYPKDSSPLRLDAQTLGLLPGLNGNGSDACLSSAPEQSMAQVNCAFATLLSPYLDSSMYCALRLSNKAWSRALESLRRPPVQLARHLPSEMLLTIYSYLSPQHFNSARHTCRDWMRASLDATLLFAMLSRGGWISSVKRDIHSHAPTATYSCDNNAQNRQWSLSQRLSRQCALSSDWKGNGLDDGPALQQSEEIDFSDLANGFASSKAQSNRGLIFVTSFCGRFQCAARDNMIFIYDVQRGSLRPTTSVVCPRRVLSMSMDVSSGRHAIAALLEGRLGMVCEFSYGRRERPDTGVNVDPKDNDHLHQTMERSGSEGEAREYLKVTNPLENTLPPLQHNRLYMQKQESDDFEAINVRSHNQCVNLHGTNDHRTHDRNLINNTWNLNLHGPCAQDTVDAAHMSNVCAQNMSLEDGTSTFYRHLCSEDDPPRSVAICPQRRCVAFGCSAGIELHWIDALTSQGLSR